MSSRPTWSRACALDKGPWPSCGIHRRSPVGRSRGPSEAAVRWGWDPWKLRQRTVLCNRPYRGAGGGAGQLTRPSWESLMESSGSWRPAPVTGVGDGKPLTPVLGCDFGPLHCRCDSTCLGQRGREGRSPSAPAQWLSLKGTPGPRPGAPARWTRAFLWDVLASSVRGSVWGDACCAFSSQAHCDSPALSARTPGRPPRCRLGRRLVGKTVGREGAAGTFVRVRQSVWFCGKAGVDAASAPRPGSLPRCWGTCGGRRTRGQKPADWGGPSRADRTI